MSLGIVKGKPMKIGTVAVLVLFFVLLALFQEAGAEHRIALVIGNGAYDADPLSDPPNDAVLMAKTLRMLGFTVEDQTNLDKKTMKRLIRDFGSKLKAQKDTVGLFYYSGHGMQVSGRNYMIPIEATIKDESDVEDGAVGVDFVTSKMRVAENRINFVILDACRDNKFEKSFKSQAKGLGKMDAPEGTLIAFAAQPHKVALQGPGDYSYFTESLIQEIVTPGISAREMLRRVRVGVYNRTDGKQVPVVEDQLLAKFYFNPKPPVISGTDKKNEKVRSEDRIVIKDTLVDEFARDGHFIAYTNGVVRDTRTGLEWVAGPNRATSKAEGKQWVETLNIGGGGWRMPSLDELRTLYEKGADNQNMTPLLEVTGALVWAIDGRDSSNAWDYRFFNFDNGKEGWVTQDYRPDKVYRWGTWIPKGNYASPSFRAFAVRSGRRFE